MQRAYFIYEEQRKKREKSSVEKRKDGWRFSLDASIWHTLAVVSNIE